MGESVRVVGSVLADSAYFVRHALCDASISSSTVTQQY